MKKSKLNEIISSEEYIFQMGFIQIIYSMMNSWFFYIYCLENSNKEKTNKYKKLNKEEYFKEIEYGYDHYNASLFLSEIRDFPYPVFWKNIIGFNRKENSYFIYYGNKPYGDDEKNFLQSLICVVDKDVIEEVLSKKEQEEKFDKKKFVLFFRKNKKFQSIFSYFDSHIKTIRDKRVHGSSNNFYIYPPVSMIGAFEKTLVFVKENFIDLFYILRQEVDWLISAINKIKKDNNFEKRWNHFKK